MPTAADYKRQNQLWESIQQIPENVLTDYLADNVIDDNEIEDICLRLEAHMHELNLSAADHAMIRQMVCQAVEHIQKQHAKEASGIAGKLGSATLSDVRSVMGSLLKSGNISLLVSDACYSDSLSPNAAIPEDRPEHYDEEEPNPID